MWETWKANIWCGQECTNHVWDKREKRCFKGNLILNQIGLKSYAIGVKNWHHGATQVFCLWQPMENSCCDITWLRCGQKQYTSQRLQKGAAKVVCWVYFSVDIHSNLWPCLYSSLFTVESTDTHFLYSLILFFANLHGLLWNMGD